MVGELGHPAAWGGGSWLSREQRKGAEEALNNAYRRLRKEEVGVPEWYGSFPSSQELTKIWSSLVELRNTLAHCAMIEEPLRMSTIKNKAEEIPTWLQSLLEGTADHVVYGRRVVINLKELYGEVAKLDELPDYLDKAQSLAGEGNDVVLTGQAPVWLYLAIAHTLHGKTRRL
ncbi:CRISPR-associated protein Csx3 [Thermatribacter velox]|uniref:CRISPR-associated protein Csx3 n=1 Tax=Thermatribacter velox TaxID=3039681 RepID=A0ABZ2YAP7_9BACT